ncbi:hypothetical protein SLEP1_g17284 [Rubroshorea leprosula]|uniref:Uncharacterized protein n=1 Tax=Rubroshorea leprosula TaxID=152421 RepID=A0AAV5J2L8_9ROSI|nr:hypothetical protein SLEP1_g17284 [Rubroshorea leprosula]
MMEYNLGLTQLVPNVVWLVITFAMYSRAWRVLFPTTNIFKYFYVLKAESAREKGWYYFTARVSTRRIRGCLALDRLPLKDGKISSFLWVTPDRQDRHRGGELKLVEGKRGKSIQVQSNPELGNVEGEVMTKAREDEPVATKRRRVKRQQPESREEIAEFIPPLPPVEAEPSVWEAEVVPQGRGMGYVPLPTLCFYKAGIRSTLKRFINTYFPKVANLVNTLLNEFFESLKERTEVNKENAKLVKKNEEADREKVNLTSKAYSRQHRQPIPAPNCNCYFSNGRKKVKLQYPMVDVTKITFGDQEEEVEENGESSIIDFHLEVELKWD